MSPPRTWFSFTVTANSAKKFLECRAEWAENKGEQKKETKRCAAQAGSGKFQNSGLERGILRRYRMRAGSKVDSAHIATD